jgi:hypothetical protein
MRNRQGVRREKGSETASCRYTCQTRTAESMRKRHDINAMMRVWVATEMLSSVGNCSTRNWESQ